MEYIKIVEMESGTSFYLNGADYMVTNLSDRMLAAGSIKSRFCVNRDTGELTAFDFEMKIDKDYVDQAGLFTTIRPKQSAGVIAEKIYCMAGSKKKLDKILDLLEEYRNNWEDE